MNLAELQARGAFVSQAPEPKEVTWVKDGDEIKFTIHIIRPSFGSVEKVYLDKSDRSVSAKFISEYVRLGDGGKEELTYEQAYQLEPSLATVFLDAIKELSTPTKN